MRLGYATLFLLYSGLFCCFDTFAQQTGYFIEFTDKQNTPYSTNQPLEFLTQRALDRRIRQNIELSARDLPVNPAYLAAVRQTGANVRYASRWMNGALIEAHAATMNQVEKLTFVRSVSEQNRVTTQGLRSAGNGLKTKNGNQTEALDYGNSLTQNAMLGIDRMHASGFTGRGIHIAVIDGGFYSANTMPVFRKHFEEQRVLGTYDFVRNQTDVYDKSEHGTQVWSALAGYQTGALVGPTYEASFWLLRTENEAGEYRIEEVNWLMAAEFADSVGVDLIQTSLGYTYFDDPSMSYLPQQMDGKTAFITRAATFAAATGMLIVVSAGNEGNDSWKTISAPADADSVLAVAAVDRSQVRAGFSSFGKIIGKKSTKPNLAAQGVGTVIMNPSNAVSIENGTSVAAPLITGLAAGLWQAFPQLTNMQLLTYLQRSGNQASTPDTLLGYGVPDFTKAYDLIQKDFDPTAPLGYVSPNPLASEELIFRVNATQLQKSLTLEFFDLQGRKLLSQTIAQPLEENRVQVSARIFKPGVYLLKASNESTRVVLRLVKL